MRVCLLQRVIFFTLAVGVWADCYSRDGETFQSNNPTSDELVSCGKGTNNCCLWSESCGSNLLCTRSGNIGRQYCADKNWTGCSDLFPEQDWQGIGLILCGENVVCYGNDRCCTDGLSQLRYVNPLTGKVSDAQDKDSDATKTPMWWKVDSSGILASLGTATASQGVAVSEATTSTNSQSTPASSDGSAAASTPTSAPSPTATNTTDQSDVSSSGGISAGAGAGIGVGATAAIIIIALLAWLFFRERKKRRALQKPAMDTTMHQAHAARKDMQDYTHEAPPDGRTELEQERARYEMDGRAGQELP